MSASMAAPALGPGPSPAWTHLRLAAGAVFSPARTFRELAERPHWILPLCILMAAVLVHTLAALPVTFARINSRFAGLAAQREGAEAAAQAEIPQLIMASTSLLASIITPLLIVLLTAGTLHLLSILLKGNLNVNGRAAFAACSHASLPLAALYFVRAPVVRATQSVNVSFGLDRWLPELVASDWALRAVQYLDPFRLWYAVLIAMAAAILYRLPIWKAIIASLGVNAIWFALTVLLMAQFG